ncbi:LOW QUALITY PROTEIN: hypothetical protein Cgig2_012375 [Carnegiea gigantea]|uniref:Major facilitator superfamily (MFS) profile domain-containing protein n=1 Tax=Carnegiea gigantea TaxID=171969 RepID=A0A9Q1KNL0_9CARY|nr:LOW QUALITY PROTEIN: hypothetical protein Cgig2_012375 [Carnegiea gigantea]
MGWLNGNRDGLSKPKNKCQRVHSELEEGDHNLSGQDSVKDNTSGSRKYVIACAFFVSLNSVILGYDVGLMSGAILFIHENLKITEVQKEVLVGCLSIVSLIGSLIGGKHQMLLKMDNGNRSNCVPNRGIHHDHCSILLYANGRKAFIWGQNWVGATIMRVYIAEISPASSRGFLTSFPETFINIGILLGYVSNYSFSGLSININWRIMLALGIFPSVIVGFALFIIPESPRWLVLQNRVEEARSILIRTIRDEKEVKERLAEMQQAAEMSNSITYEL